MFADMALSVVAGNRLDIYHRRGEPIPLGWALDRDGNPTTSPLAKEEGGTLAPIAGYKGIGISVMLSTFTSFLAAAPFDTGRINLETMERIPKTTGHWFAAYDIAQFTDLEEFCRNVRETRDLIRAAPRRADVDRIYAPGDIENEFAQKHRAEGVPLEQFTLNDLAWVAETLGLEWNLV
jgi:LDH2 family malate/lactate/ureidoglycolate dehydrogenase